MNSKAEAKRQDRKPIGLKRYRSSAILWLGLLILLVAVNISLDLTKKPEVHRGEIWTINRVVSGQTIEGAPSDNLTAVLQRVRLIGINAPLKEQSPWGDRARQRLEELVKEQKVLLEFDVNPKDNSEKVLAYLWKGDRLINAQLVEEGLVLADSVSPNVKYEAELSRAQSKARLLEVGIWDPQNPLRMSPREFRRQIN
ncbi:thermonuclease family protein [Tumidithrix elongata RA019]|uniref:Thermonuclease family protein n=1 Tax=Tumidithrix elongata BACA0141 TaxID=2716417 RepID=A0AAW9PRV6_9CYAN|nr:thermonuclease family protein [Tumidithrix elongata RA019]